MLLCCCGQGMRRLSAQSPKMSKLYDHKIPAGRFGTPEDIGLATLYLVSNAAHYVTGTILTVDGGAWMTTQGMQYPEMVMGKL